MSRSDLVQVVIGSDYLPTEITIFDHALRPVYDGVTPVSRQLPPGTYEIELRNGREIHKRVVRLSPDGGYDGAELGLTVDTPVPVSAASGRRQSVAEAATILSSKLHRSGRPCGLVLLLMNAGSEAADFAPGITVLDGRFQPVPEFSELPFNAGQYWSGRSVPVRPGGYIIRAGVRADEYPGAQVDVPVWVSAGYQTLVFIPCHPYPRLDRMSIHMTPMAEIWTGFDPAANALELAQYGWRKNRCLLAEARRSDLPELAARNPVFGIVAAYLLRLEARPDQVGGAADIAVRLVDVLTSLVPGHPDVVLLGHQSANMSWPPSTAAGYRRLLEADAADRGAIRPGSLAGAVSGEFLVLGPWTAWKALQAPPGSSRSTAGFPAAAAQRGPDAVGLRFLTALRRWRFRYTLARSNATLVAQVLRTVVLEESALDRVRMYQSSVLDLRGMRALRRTVGGRSTRTVAVATSLPVAVARQAVGEVNRRVEQELKRKSRDGGPLVPPAKGMGIPGASFRRLAGWLSPVFVVAAGWLAGVVAKTVPGTHFTGAQLSVSMLAGATSAACASWKWRQGWQQHVRLVNGQAAQVRQQHAPSPAAKAAPAAQAPTATRSEQI